MKNVQTENVIVQAFVQHVLIDQHLLLPFNATSQDSDQIPVLEIRDQNYFILELFIALSRIPRHSFHCNYLPC